MITSEALLVLAGLIHLAPTEVPAGSSVSAASPTPQAVSSFAPVAPGSMRGMARRGFFVNPAPRSVPQVIQPSVQYVPQVVQPGVQIVQPSVPQVLQSQMVQQPVTQPVVPTQTNMGGPRYAPVVGTISPQMPTSSFGSYYINYGSCPNCRR